MKSLTGLWNVAALELATWCGVTVARDLERLRDRVEHEGESFLTLTLPQFGADFEKSLAEGGIAPGSFRGFHRTAGVPAFMRGFLELVFDSRTSLLLESPSHDAIYAVRQLCHLFKKLEGKCTDRRMAKAVRDFKNCEEELKLHDRNHAGAELDELARLFALVYGDCVDEVNREVDRFELSPKHGPGATADRKVGNGKYVQAEWPERLEAVFPYLEYVLPSVRYHDYLDRVQFLKPGAERPVKVTLVPKTRKTPRVIAIEPTAMQYMQQAMLQSLVPKLESNHLNLLGFTDQEPNRQMAAVGSRTGEFATLDLSEASDRVLNSIVIRLTKAWPSFSEAVQACRTREAILPDGQRVRLSKFASMGSALCFPMEAMVFSTIVLYGIQLAEKRRLVASDVRKLRGRVRVYGDDIVLPVGYTDVVVAALEAFGLRVNRSKSFSTGRFRESCGGDYYDGTDVTPVRLKRYAPTTPRTARDAVHWVEFSNSLHKRGLWKTAEYARLLVERALRSTLPVVGDTSPAIGLFSFTGVPEGKMDRYLHKPMVRAWVVTDKSPRSEVDDVWALRKTLAGDFSDPSNRDHLKRAGRNASLHIKRRWVPAG